MDDSDGSLNLQHQALEAALDCRWQDCLKLNRQIIKVQPENVDALNRLAHAYFELGNLSLAKKYYLEVLKFDLYNPIAGKNLKIIQAFKKSPNGHTAKSSNGFKISPDLFLQEPGKTKIINLLKVAEPQKLSQAFCGMPVELIIKNRGITIVDPDGSYLGVLPDDIAHQLLRLTKGGNRFKACIKSVRVNGLSILVRETYRSSKFRNQPSFLEYSLIADGTDVIANLSRKDGIDEEAPPDLDEATEE